MFIARSVRRTDRAPVTNLERETGFEPATPSLEGWRSTAELFPRCVPLSVVARGRPGPGTGPATVPAPTTTAREMVGRGGFEPPKAFASRFTVCPLWPLGYLPESSGLRREPRQKLALARGFEPLTHCLQGSCSTPELRQHRQNFTLVLTSPEVKPIWVLLAPAAGAPHSRGSRPPPPRSGSPGAPSWARSEARRRSGRGGGAVPPPLRRAQGTRLR